MKSFICDKVGHKTIQCQILNAHSKEFKRDPTHQNYCINTAITEIGKIYKMQLSCSSFMICFRCTSFTSPHFQGYVGIGHLFLK